MRNRMLVFGFAVSVAVLLLVPFVVAGIQGDLVFAKEVQDMINNAVFVMFCAGFMLKMPLEK